MSLTVGKIAEFMEELAPVRLAEGFDNCGLLVGNSSYNVERVLLALDATMQIVEEAIEKRCEMIVTHHPINREGVKKINDCTVLGRKILKLAENKIALYAAHTNLDKADGGVNDSLCELLELRDVSVKKTDNGDNEFIRLGKLNEPMNLKQLSEKYKKKLSLEYLPVVGNCDTMIETVAVVSGNGMSFLNDVAAGGAQLFISGDVRYHDANAAIEQGLCMMDLTHYKSEVIITGPLKLYLDKKISEAGLNAQIIVSEIDAQPLRVFI